MCGIAGLLGQADGERLESMLECLTHRGPDGMGRYVDSGADLAMGMRRLAIIDLEGGDQPIYNEDGSVVVVFNGEIYNYRELRADLRERGHDFSTESDTEVIVHLWEEYGERTPERLDGMFAFAVWDGDRESLFLARDRVGVKPLYYAVGDGEFRWASEIEPLLRSGVAPALDPAAVRDYFEFRFSPWPRTLFARIDEVAPGTSLLVTDDGVQTRRYWTPATERSTSGDPASRLRELLERSVRRRLVADVPVGAFLSGGLDSSAIAALMTQYQDDVNTYSISFEAEEYDESGEAAFVSSHLGTDHHEVPFTPASLSDLPEATSYYGEPLADPAILPTMELARRASEDVTVVLTGEGADELLGGYWYYDALRRHRRLARWLPAPVFAMARAAGDRSPVAARHLRYAGGLDSDRRAVSTVAGQFRLSPGRYLEDGRETDVAGTDDRDDSAVDRRTPMVHSEGDQRHDREPISVGRRDSAVVVDRAFEHARPEPAHRQMAFDLRYGLPSNLLYKVDRATMRWSLEARVPFLDHEIVDFAHSLPTSQKLDGRYKPLLRRAVSDLLPDRTLQRSKSGFNLPIGEWLRGGHDAIDRWFTRERLAEAPFLDPSRVDRLRRQHLRGRFDRDLTLWKVLSYVCWYHTVVAPYR